MGNRGQRKQSFQAQGRSQAQLGNEEYLTQIGAERISLSALAVWCCMNLALPQAACERRAFGAKQIPSTAWERGGNFRHLTSDLRPPISDHIPLGTARLGVGFPHAKAAAVGVAVVTGLYAGRQFLELLGVAAAKDDVIGDERELELLEAEKDVTHPFLLAKTLEAGLAEVFFDNEAAFIRQVA